MINPGAGWHVQASGNGGGNFLLHETSSGSRPRLWFANGSAAVKYQEFNDQSQRRLPFSGQTYELTNIELSIYDYLMGCQTAIEMNGGLLNPSTSELQGELRKGLDWFRTHNAKAYMVLLD